jgi:hypothetical protein
MSVYTCVGLRLYAGCTREIETEEKARARETEREEEEEEEVREREMYTCQTNTWSSEVLLEMVIHTRVPGAP